jgi:hypothetical protein
MGAFSTIVVTEPLAKKAAQIAPVITNRYIGKSLFIGTGFLMDNTSVKPMSRPVAKEQFPL